METIICLQWKVNSQLCKLGCSYYLSTSLELQLMEDIVESNNFEYTTMSK